MREAGERFYTPNELADGGIMSLVKQWQERKAGRLQCYRIGRRFYTDKSIWTLILLSAKATIRKAKIGAMLRNECRD